MADVSAAASASSSSNVTLSISIPANDKREKLQTVALRLGATVELKCTLEDEIALSDLTMDFGNVTFKPTTSSHTVSHRIEKYSRASMGVYVCSAKSNTKKMRVSRSIKLEENSTVPEGFIKCEMNACNNGGHCVIREPDPVPYCICVNGYAGARCEEVLVEPILGLPPDMMRYGFPTTTALDLVLAFIIAALCFLLYRERRARKNLVSSNKQCGMGPSFGEVNRSSFIGYDPEFTFPYKPIVVEPLKHQNGSHTDPLRQELVCPITEVEEVTIHLQSDEQRRIRANYRERLPGTSDSRLLDSPPAS